MNDRFAGVGSGSEDFASSLLLKAPNTTCPKLGRAVFAPSKLLPCSKSTEADGLRKDLAFCAATQSLDLIPS
eukprot:CAMPEP_0114163990 /NCGR_PEP_ID=MMETSP0043_2-20121206/30391_1 /TAXON_ID=464988 /ORGANISM="Hemiselmis andersenii, Strain CCMP644" /LENGTH=71 /DNA_ID=CAMNT_0001260545 /DNA_START=83 /DNA_END=294 /DNA_ORIENTATION=+